MGKIGLSPRLVSFRMLKSTRHMVSRQSFAFPFCLSMLLILTDLKKQLNFSWHS